MKIGFTNSPTLQLTSLLLAVSALTLMNAGVSAQTRYMYLKGESVAPAYEGWWANPDG
jgi:hypothetical protein